MDWETSFATYINPFLLCGCECCLVAASAYSFFEIYKGVFNVQEIWLSLNMGQPFIVPFRRTIIVFFCIIVGSLIKFNPDIQFQEVNIILNIEIFCPLSITLCLTNMELYKDFHQHSEYSYNICLLSSLSVEYNKSQNYNGRISKMMP